MIGRLSDIDLRLLRIFVSVVDAGGFSLATAKLNVAESTISQHMTDLEKRLGMRLCERGRAGFRLTADGEQVYKATIDLPGHGLYLANAGSISNTSGGYIGGGSYGVRLISGATSTVTNYGTIAGTKGLYVSGTSTSAVME